MNIAGAVVLYEPDKDVLANIQSYLPYIEELYVIDNSETVNRAIIEKIQALPKVQYFSMGGNKGIAAALNYALECAIGFDWLLTMDQDSSFADGMVERYFNKAFEILEQRDNIATFGINYVGGKSSEGEEIKEVEEVITSGALVNVVVARKIGGFLDELFIDEVDHEFCYRAKAAGYAIIFLPDVLLEHHLGKTINMSIGGVRLRTVQEHSAIRRYYMARNSVYVMCQYPHIRAKKMVGILKEVLKILFAEVGKKEKFYAIAEGVADALKGKMGKKEQKIL